jgi:predicted alpha/beta-fold hydrolase
MSKDKIKEHLISTEPPLVERLNFRPAIGLTSPHLQTILPTLFYKGGKEPPSAAFFIPLEDGDSLCCKMSTPSSWHLNEKTIMIIHGLGGSDASGYMVRLSRKFYQAGFRTVRVNLRGSGSGAHLARRPYHGGVSQDVLQVIQTLKQQTPQSPIILIGFSLGGNIALKLVGELGEKANSLLEHTFAICPPIDLAQTTHQLLSRSNRFYHRYYLHGLKRVGYRWVQDRTLHSIIDFDHFVTAPQWGYQDAFDYYRQCSSSFFLPLIRHSCHLIFSADDPFIDYRLALQFPLSPSVKIWLSPSGGHMGFLGWAGKEHGYFWLDRLLLTWVIQSGIPSINWNLINSA